MRKVWICEGNKVFAWHKGAEDYSDKQRYTTQIYRTSVYEMIIAHEFKGRSGYHGPQPCLRLMRDIYPLTHIYATGHIHRTQYMRGCFYPAVGLPDQHLIVAGTFKTGADSFTLRKVGPRGVLGILVLQL